MGPTSSGMQYSSSKFFRQPNYLYAFRIVVMFSETDSCPYILTSKWISHEESCAAACHNCITCNYCMTNINYWGAIDDYLQIPDAPAAPLHRNPYKMNLAGKRNE